VSHAGRFFPPNLQQRVSEQVEFNYAPPDMFQVISEVVYTANHSTDINKTNLTLKTVTQ